MELRELKYFLAVAKEQSITKAAKELYISQPSLSKQMQNLEAELGQTLFIRGSRKITLTEAGLLLKKRAEEMLALYEKTQAEIASCEKVAGTILIGGGESYTMRIVAKVAKKMQDEHPLVKFTFFSGDASFVTERLDKGLIDFGVLVDVSDLAKYNSLRLPNYDEWGVLMPNDCELAKKDFVTADDLRDKPLLVSMQCLEKGSQIYEWFNGKVSHLEVRAKYNLIYNATLLVREKMGYALALKNLINTTGETLTFKPLYPQVKTYLDIVWKKYAVFSKPAQIFLNMLKSEIEKEFSL